MCGGGLGDLDRVSGGDDKNVCGVDTVLSCAVGGGLCDLDRVSAGGDTNVCGVDTVLSGAVSGCMCDVDRVSRGDKVVGVCDVSMYEGGELDMCVVVSWCETCSN